MKKHKIYWNSKIAICYKRHMIFVINMIIIILNFKLQQNGAPEHGQNT